MSIDDRPSGRLAKFIKSDAEELIENKVDDALFELITSMNDKLKSKALNGGFDMLTNKVHEIASQQNVIQASVDDIKSVTGELHDALYHPDDGVFAKVRDVKDEQTKTKMNLTLELEDVKRWRNRIMWFTGVIMTSAIGVLVKVMGAQIIELFKR